MLVLENIHQRCDCVCTSVYILNAYNSPKIQTLTQHKYFVTAITVKLHLNVSHRRSNILQYCCKEVKPNNRDS